MSVQVITSSIPSNAVALDKPSSTSVRSPIKSGNTSQPERIRSSEVHPDSFVQLNRAYQSLSETTSKINQVADSVRQADTAMQEIGRSVDRMKGSLDQIIKNYPPFPPGSEQRVKALKNFSALRNEIEKLTYPPEPSLVPKLIADPSKSSGSFSVRVDEKGTSVQLDRQRVDPGPGGLNIPQLPVFPPEDSGDKPIHAAIAALANAASTISNRRQALADNFAQQALPAVALSVTRQTGMSDAAQSDSRHSVQTAQTQSLAIQDVFSALPIGISSTGKSFMRQLL